MSKLEPSQRETWTAVVTGPDAKKAVAEMVAALYDESLDAYLPYAWPAGFGVFYVDQSNLQMQFENVLKPLQVLNGGWVLAQKDVQMTYRSFPADITTNLWGYMYFGARGTRMRGVVMGGMAAPSAAPVPMAAAERRSSALNRDGVEMQEAAKGANGLLADRAAGVSFTVAKAVFAADKPGAGAGQLQVPDLTKVSARRNLNETAFFFPT